MSIKNTLKFAIYEVVNGVRNESPVAEGSNDIYGAVTFNEALTYNKVGGPYFYHIVELKPANAPDYITFDTTVHKLNVTVTDNNGELVANPVIESVAGNSIVFENIYEAYPATLIIKGTKTLTGRVLTENDFQFVLTNTDVTPNTGLYAVNAESGSNESTFSFPELTFTEEGTYTYKVSEYDPTASIAGYADGVKYDKDVFTVTVTVKDNGEGKLVASYTVDGSATKQIAFENSYEPTPIKVPIKGIKDIIGRGLTDADRFTFELYNVNYDAATGVWTKGSVKEYMPNIGDTISFTPIEITKAGVYRYMVSEKEENAGGIKYDKTTWRVAIIVTDDGNGNLTPEVRYVNDSGRQNAMFFLNTYTVSDGFIEIEGKKELENKKIANEQFEFNFYETDGTFEIEETAERKDYAKNAADGSFKFKLSYTKSDIGKTFYYAVQEKNAGRKINGITHSSNKYLITVKVDDNYDGTLKIDKTIMLGEQEQDTLVFKNTYTTTATSAVIKGEKKLEGRDLLSTDKFEFELYSANAVGDVWEKADRLDSANNDADGTFEFKSIPYSKEGKNRYIVVEKKGKDNIGISYDEAEWHVLVDVVDNQIGELVPTVTYYKGDSAEPMVFNNTYTVKSKTIPIEGVKTLKGRPLRDGEFEFELYEVDETFTIDAGQEPDITANNNAERKFVFNVEYTMADIGETFYYVVKEADDGKNKVTYSKAEYYVTVSVADNYDGTLKITKSIVLDEKSVEAIEFTNIYKDSTSVDIDINKKVENKGSESITPEGFEFLLEKVGTDEAVKVKTDAEGKAKISLEFTEADIGKAYDYKLTEVNDGRENVKYSTEEYDISIEITLNEDDNFEARLVIGDKAVDELKAEFVNEYDYTPPVVNPPVDNPPSPPPSSPVTGDSTNINLWLALLFVSGGGIIGTAIYGKKRRKEQ